MTCNTGEVSRPVNFGIYPVQYEPVLDGPTNCITQVDDADSDITETSAKTTIQSSEQHQQNRQHLVTTEIDDQHVVTTVTEMTEEPGRRSSPEALCLPYPIQATPSCCDINVIEPVQALDDYDNSSQEGAVGGVEASDDFNNQDYAIHESSIEPYSRNIANNANRQMSHLPRGIPQYEHIDVGQFFRQQSPEERETRTSEEESSDVESS